MFASIRDACIKDAKEMGKDLEKVTRTWKDEKPEIMTEAKVGELVGPSPGVPKSFTASAWPKADGSKGYWKYVWLDLGTKVRYAHMTKGFIPKTRSGQLQSWAGKGGMLFVNKKRPLPGIKARHFTVALRKKWEKPFHDHMKKAVAEAAKASGHGM